MGQTGDSTQKRSHRVKVSLCVHRHLYPTIGILCHMYLLMCVVGYVCTCIYLCGGGGGGKSQRARARERGREGEREISHSSLGGSCLWACLLSEAPLPTPVFVGATSSVRGWGWGQTCLGWQGNKKRQTDGLGETTASRSLACLLWRVERLLHTAGEGGSYYTGQV